MFFALVGWRIITAGGKEAKPGIEGPNRHSEISPLRNSPGTGAVTDECRQAGGTGLTAIVGSRLAAKRFGPNLNISKARRHRAQ